MQAVGDRASEDCAAAVLRSPSVTTGNERVQVYSRSSLDALLECKVVVCVQDGQEQAARRNHDNKELFRLGTGPSCLLLPSRSVVTSVCLFCFCTTILCSLFAEQPKGFLHKHGPTNAADLHAACLLQCLPRPDSACVSVRARLVRSYASTATADLLASSS